MPTVIRIGPYRFFFYSSDGDEPPHVHVERDDKIAKIWIQPIRLAYSGGLNRKEIAKVIGIVEEHQTTILEVWHEYFSC